MKSNNRLSCRSIAKKLNAKSKIISKSSVHRILKSKGMRYVYPKKKPFLSKKHIEKRLLFAKKHQNKSMAFWKSVIWNDECAFEAGGTGRKLWVQKGNPAPINFTKNIH